MENSENGTLTTALKTGKKQPMASQRTNKIVPRMQIESVSGETTVHTKRGQKEVVERDTRQEEEEIEENEVFSAPYVVNVPFSEFFTLLKDLTFAIPRQVLVRDKDPYQDLLRLQDSLSVFIGMLLLAYLLLAVPSLIGLFTILAVSCLVLNHFRLFLGPHFFPRHHRLVVPAHVLSISSTVCILSGRLWRLSRGMHGIFLLWLSSSVALRLGPPTTSTKATVPALSGLSTSSKRAHSGSIGSGEEEPNDINILGVDVSTSENSPKVNWLQVGTTLTLASTLAALR
ncbi:hypothetical protein MRX96_011649 [Rhipicephalus microplus]